MLTALGAPVWRATLMLALYLGARLLYREKSMLNAIGAAALALMIVNPQVLFGASFQLTFLCVWLVAAVGLPVLERTTQPFMRGSRHIDSQSFDFVLPARVVQYRLDLRMIAGRLQRFAGRRFPLPALALAPRTLMGAGELLLISIVMQIGLALPDGVLLPSRDRGGTAGQLAGGAPGGIADAGRSCGDGAGIRFANSGQGSSSDRRERRHSGHGSLARPGLQIADPRVPTPGTAMPSSAVPAITTGTLARVCETYPIAIADMAAGIRSSISGTTSILAGKPTTVAR